MDYYSKMILLNGEPNDNVVRCNYDKNRKQYGVVFNSREGPYYYRYSKVQWLENPEIVNKELYKFTNSNGITFFNINQIRAFKDSYFTYLRFFFEDGTHKSYNSKYLQIEKNVLSNTEIKNTIDYYKQVSEKIGLKSEEGTNILKAQFEKMLFVSEDSVLAKFLKASSITRNQLSPNEIVVFPFGCNLSQITAVNNAVSNQISVIEGPPGTGKTQTILNIIANVVMRGYMVAVVSNNNSATDNVFEKLQKYGFDYIAAQLGNSENKNDFISSKQFTYPDFSNDIMNKSDKYRISNEIQRLKAELIEMLENQNRIAELKRDLSALETEKSYFDEYFATTYDDKPIFRNKFKMTSAKVLSIWNECQEIFEKKKKISFWFKLKSILFYGIKNFSIYKLSIHDIIPIFKKLFYELKVSEIRKEIKTLQDSLSEFGYQSKMNELTDKSIKLFKASLANKYISRGQRVNFDNDDLWKNPNQFLAEYPVILSTTHSVRNSLKGITYDYVIVDESSQVDLVTGVLAMSCARNIVIVGDLKQLPNVITDEDRKYITNISDKANIPEKYRYEQNSLLSSVCAVFNNIPRKLLREHYRCHPKIINFCNQKFYNNQLIIMTEDNEEDDVLKVYVTSEGNHARGHFNQRQIEEIQQNVLPELSSNSVGIISPYKAQTSALIKILQSDIDISTVHKFQGREKDDIIISTVDNEITDFTDNPNMLNVAVSRAKNRLRLVVSDNEKNKNTNIGDLVKYIQYNNFEIKKSDIFSVFDMLYKCYENSRKIYLSKHKRVSEFDSENLMYSVIEEVLSADKFSKLDVVAHQPLNSIIRNPHKLSDKETAYAMNTLTHVDFLIFNKTDKSPVLAIEVDGYAFHKNGSRQKERDYIKNIVLEKYDIPLIRFNTTGSMEKKRLQIKLSELIS